MIHDYLSRLVSDNLLHRDGDIFQIDANFGMTGCVPELLIQSHTDTIRLLPALPADWPDGSFRGLRARGGLSFDVSWQNGVLTAATVRATQSGTYRIALPDRELAVELEAGHEVDLVRSA